MAQLMPLPLTVSCFSKIQIGFTSLVPAHPGSPGQRAVKRVCVCVWQTLFAENKEKMINATLSSLLDREAGDQTSVPAEELEDQFQATRRLVASKAGFGAFMSLPQ